MTTASTLPNRPIETFATETVATDDLKTMAQRSQQMVAESIQRHPGLCVGAALAAGVVLGCLIKRN